MVFVIQQESLPLHRVLIFLPFSHLDEQEFFDISPRNLDSSLSFIQPGISHDVLCI